MVQPTDKDKSILTTEELVVPKKLLEREMNFKYEILHRSAEISAKLFVGDGKETSSFIFTEFQEGLLSVHNQSPNTIKNGYAVCSHPMIFNFARIRLFD